MKNDGTVSCEDPKQAQSVDEGKKALEGAGIPVHGAEKKSDGLMRATVCGMPQGNFNHYLIQASDVKKAEALGYSRATN